MGTSDGVIATSPTALVRQKMSFFIIFTCRLLSGVCLRDRILSRMHVLCIVGAVVFWFKLTPLSLRQQGGNAAVEMADL